MWSSRHSATITAFLVSGSYDVLVIVKHFTNASKKCDNTTRRVRKKERMNEQWVAVRA